jgi:putative membrane protein
MWRYGYGCGFGGLGGFGGWGMIIGMVMQLAFLAIVVMAAVWLYKGVIRGGHSHSNNALEILKQRYAKGEITGEEYQHMKKELE